MVIEYALVLIKPDGVKKSLTGNVLTKLSQTGCHIIGSKVLKVSRELASEHYRHLKDKPFFESVIDYIQGKTFGGAPFDRVFAFVYKGENAIAKLREIVGATNPESAEPTTIRGSYGRIAKNGTMENVVHCSSDTTDAKREIQLWFGPNELTEEIYPTKKETVTEEKTIWA
ncbi:MAG: nucleoside-diphosphate kinase [Elusimicrobia bacterium]|nr:nucleoside-diphosphate kinase [Elusimicrobiota bacterium]